MLRRDMRGTVTRTGMGCWVGCRYGWRCRLRSGLRSFSLSEWVRSSWMRGRFSWFLLSDRVSGYDFSFSVSPIHGLNILIRLERGWNHGRAARHRLGSRFSSGFYGRKLIHFNRRCTGRRSFRFSVACARRSLRRSLSSLARRNNLCTHFSFSERGSLFVYGSLFHHGRSTRARRACRCFLSRFGSCATPTSPRSSHNPRNGLALFNACPSHSTFRLVCQNCLIASAGVLLVTKACVGGKQSL